VTHFLPSSVAQRYVSRVIQTSLELTVTVKFDPELDFLKQNLVMSAEWVTRDSLPHFLSCTEIFVRGCRDVAGIRVTVTCNPELEFLNQNWVISAELSRPYSLPPFL
jgi:hypothetical protein